MILWLSSLGRPSTGVRLNDARSKRAWGRLALQQGRGGGAGLIRASDACERRPLTSVLSPSQGERRNYAH